MCRHSQSLTASEETAQANRSQASEKKNFLVWDRHRAEVGSGKGGSGAWRVRKAPEDMCIM